MLRGRLLGLGFVLNGEVELELGRQLVLRVETVREVHAPDAAVGVDLKKTSHSSFFINTTPISPLSVIAKGLGYLERQDGWSFW